MGIYRGKGWKREILGEYMFDINFPICLLRLHFPVYVLRYNEK